MQKPSAQRQPQERRCCEADGYRDAGCNEEGRERRQRVRQRSLGGDTCAGRHDRRCPAYSTQRPNEACHVLGEARANGRQPRFQRRLMLLDEVCELVARATVEDICTHLGHDIAVGLDQRPDHWIARRHLDDRAPAALHLEHRLQGGRDLPGVRSDPERCVQVGPDREPCTGHVSQRGRTVPCRRRRSARRRGRTGPATGAARSRRWTGAARRRKPA